VRTGPLDPENQPEVAPDDGANDYRQDVPERWHTTFRFNTITVANKKDVSRYDCGNGRNEPNNHER
jgi:hypothetical protein